MKIDKKDDNIYTKQLDMMDSYLLNIIKRFFANDVDTINNSAESIILEAVARAKKEITLSGRYGVASVNDKTGAVTLTAGDIGAEPIILLKRSGFNKPFGTKADTICEGNDARLSNARFPLEHTHTEYAKYDAIKQYLLTVSEKQKLNSIEENANYYVHPTGSGDHHVPPGGVLGQYLKWQTDGQAYWDKLDISVATNINDGLLSKEDKDKLDNIEAGAKSYTHPLTPGYRHIPSGGGEGNILKWYADGQAYWGDSLLDLVTYDANGAMSKEDKKKLDKIENGANKYVHPLNHSATEIVEDAAHNFITIEEKNKLDNLSEAVKGNDGEVYFVSGNSSKVIKPAYTLYKANIIDTDKDLLEAIDTVPDFSEIFNSWKRFSHDRTTNQPASLSETNAWRLDSLNNRIICTVNSVTYIGFISKDKYDVYTHEVTVKSTDSDDDRIGVVVAFATDSNGIEHTISALREMEGPNTWYLIYDYLKSTSKTIGSMIIPGDIKKGWSSYPNGSLIRVERNGDIITVYASPFNTNIISPSSKITLDLSSDPKYDIFKGPCAYGYSCMSQNSSTFADIKFNSGFSDAIYDILNNKTYIFQNGKVSISPDRTVYTDIGIGKFVFNDRTKKLFYINGKDDIITIPTNSGGDINASLSSADRAKLDGIEVNANKYIHPTTSGNKHIPSGGGSGQVLGWKSNGEAQWKNLDTDKTTFETTRLKKRGVVTLTLPDGSATSSLDIDLSLINFYSAATYTAFYINSEGNKEQLPAMVFNGLAISDIIKADINESRLKITVTRQNTSANKAYKIYYEIFDIDNSLTIQRAQSIKVLNIYPGTTGATYTFANWKGEKFTLPQTAQCKRWMEEPNDESPKGYGQGLISVDCVDIANFNADPYSYLKNPNGSWKYDTIYQGAWDSNNGKSYSTIAVEAIKDVINSGLGYIGGHDTISHLAATANTLEVNIGIITHQVAGGWCMNNKISVTKLGMPSSFPWNLGDPGTILDIPISHVTNQYYTGDIWFKFIPPPSFVDTATVNGVSGTDNFYLGTYNNTAFIQTGHSNGAATNDEQKILANVFYYLSNK